MQEMAVVAGPDSLIRRLAEALDNAERTATLEFGDDEEHQQWRALVAEARASLSPTASPPR